MLRPSTGHASARASPRAALLLAYAPLPTQPTTQSPSRPAPPDGPPQVRCRLSKRQRMLYEDYMAASEVQSTLASTNFLGIVGVLMQLRKVGVCRLWTGCLP
jgi:hypothetical protein